MMTFYRGRFAPTPSGPLHLGSLLTALASWLDARSSGGQWLLRIDDLDTPRNQPGADSVIMDQLEAHGLHWDEIPRYQSRHLAEYQAAFDQLETTGLLYRCNCTRRRLSGLRLAGDEPIYDGHCLRHPPTSPPWAWRIQVTSALDISDEANAGYVTVETGDFVIKRADGTVAYQLACAVDENALRITHVVRGSDLLESSTRQIYLLERLGLQRPRYRHLPVLVDTSGRKLSKQNGAAAVTAQTAEKNLLQCLTLLGQQPPHELCDEKTSDILAWARAHWNIGKIARVRKLGVE